MIGTSKIAVSAAMLLIVATTSAQSKALKSESLSERAELVGAILKDKVDVAKKLLDSNKYDLNAYDFLGKVKSLAMAKLLVKSGAHPNQPSKFSFLTPLEYAVSGAVQTESPSFHATISAILAVGGDVNTPRPEYRPSLMEMVIDGPRHKRRPDVLELLLKAGLDPNKRYGVHRPAEQRKFPISGAAFNGRLDLMQVLLKHGARMSVTTFEGNTLLHVASLEDKPANREVVAFLLKKGMNREAKNKAGDRAIDIAKRKKYKEMIALLSR